MFVSKKEWEEMCNSNRALLKDKTEKSEIIDNLNILSEEARVKIARLEEESKHKDNIINIQRERIDTANKDYNILLEANQKLTEWVNKIINEVGIYEVQDRRSIAIPICKNPVKTAFGKIDDIKTGMEEFMSQEEIIIPEIRFIKMK